MGDVIVIAKIFAKKFKTLLMVEEFFNTPKTKFVIGFGFLL